MKEFLLYPGCSMEYSARAYEKSLNAISGPLGMNLKEIDDWNCCGATEYLGITVTPAYALIARNLAIGARAANGTRELVAPCSACYLNLAKVDNLMTEHEDMNRQVNECLAAGGLKYKPGSVRVRHILDVIVSDIGGVVMPSARSSVLIACATATGVTAVAASNVTPSFLSGS